MAEKGYTVNSLNKAIDLIENLVEHGPSSLADLNNRLGLDKATMYRLLSTLKNRGYVEQSQVDHRYFNTIKMFQLGSREIDRGGLRDLIRPYLKKLSSTFREVVHLALLVEPGRAVCIDKVESQPGRQPVRFEMSLGSDVSLYASSTGKAILAFSSEERQNEALSQISFERFSSKTINNAAALKKELRQTRRQGYAIDDGEAFESIYCLGVPILNFGGEANAAISVTGPRDRMLEKKEEIVKALLENSRELSILYGYPAESWPPR